jgi:LysR family transcriptional regulator, transcriptional activator of the cysJI operon
MTFRHLEIFVAVCESLGMTEASRRLSISQPSVSQAVKELESECQAVLLERMGKRIALTAPGEACLDYARQMLRLRDELGVSVREEAESAPIRVGATVTIGTYLLPRIAARSRRAVYPVVENTARIERMLLEGSLDLALVEGQTSSPLLERRHFYRDRLVIVCSPENTAGARRLQARELKGKAFYIREEGSGSRELFEFAMRRKGLDYKVAGELNNTEALKNFARADKENFAVISALALDGSVVAVDVPSLGLERDFDLVYRRGKAESRALADFSPCLEGFARG